MVDGVTEQAESSNVLVEAVSRPPLVFISHDTRDAALAEAFSRLLSNVSAGVLKSFRSSDKSGKQGIAYGVEWFPEIMRNMQMATDVVCLLTANSVNRPWILFEAGVAKGKLDTPILGIALGIPLSAASAGPFAQFQNSDDDEDSLVKLVRQLVSKIPNADPDDDVIRPHVQSFMQKVIELTGTAVADASLDESLPAGESDARLFEEVKVMFGELSTRLERMERPSIVGTSRLPNPEQVYQLTREAPTPEQGFRLAASMLKSPLPWLYDLGMETLLEIRRARTPAAAHEKVERFARTAHASADAWYFASRESRRSEYLHDYIQILSDALHSIAESSPDR